MSAQPKHVYSLEEYLALDRASEERLEYWDGEVYAMSGVNRQHSRVEINLIAALDQKISAQGCQLFAANTRIKVAGLPPYRYADLSALCGEAEFVEIGGVEVLLNPALIVEILSRSTEAKDRGVKFSQYKTIASFTEYLLIAPDRVHVSWFIKRGDGFGLQQEFNALDDVITLNSVGCEITLREIYRMMTFDA